MKEEEDEEWGEYREKLKDYSVLKIDSVRLVDSIDTEVSISILSKKCIRKIVGKNRIIFFFSQKQKSFHKPKNKTQCYNLIQKTCD